ncbi:endoribonuclease YbeY isoform X1 [Hylobates moloch]|uniref:endoribonuclease YbeY isoform X1 n=1 Tax=Hylobates moloch TaxID=81572 RepID=UPI001362F8D5|nr:endoribonuclease YbeY isoform X1 [Hylobates moloch]
MSLVIRNLQRVIPIRRAPLRSKIEIVRRILGVQKFDVGIICVDNKNIQHINRIYRDRNVPTDVLSFPFHEHLKAGEFPQPDFPDDYNLGDIFLGVEYIFHQCKENEDYNDVLTVTATHGLCHLLGFTHGSEAEWQQIQLLTCQEECGILTGVALNLQICQPCGGSDPCVCAAVVPGSSSTSLRCSHFHVAKAIDFSILAPELRFSETLSG